METLKKALKSRTIRFQILAAIMLVFYQLIPGLELPAWLEVVLMSGFITGNIILRFVTTQAIADK